MKTLMNGLLKGRITRWGFLAVLLIAAGATVGWMHPKETQKQYRFGGGWIGTDGAGTLWSVLQIPLDPAGRTAAIRVNTLAGGLGNTEATGEGEMISRDTAKWTLMTYVTQGNPPQVSQIWVLVGTLKFTGPDSWEINYTVKIYQAADDANGDGFPDAGATPIEIPGLTGTAKRVPIP
jgi:hypothetical protein